MKTELTAQNENSIRICPMYTRPTPFFFNSQIGISGSLVWNVSFRPNSKEEIRRTTTRVVKISWLLDHSSPKDWQIIMIVAIVVPQRQIPDTLSSGIIRSSSLSSLPAVCFLSGGEGSRQAATAKHRIPIGLWTREDLFESKSVKCSEFAIYIDLPSPAYQVGKDSPKRSTHGRADGSNCHNIASQNCSLPRRHHVWFLD
jgi:hypothetical protein